MAAIVIDGLSVPNKDILYKDLRLDLQLNYTKNKQLLKTKEIKDIQNSENIEAIKNSLFNLFTTIPGQKILNPIYGLNLTQYLFIGVTAANARLIGEAIFSGIQKYEPRIVIKNINIVPEFDNNQYNITLVIDVPTLNIGGVTLEGILSDSGYYFN